MFSKLKKMYSVSYKKPSELTEVFDKRGNALTLVIIN